jgi:ankyrin repeat protein
MLAHGGDASRVDEHGWNVLHLGMLSTNAECCQELLVHGADPCGLGDDKRTPMHVAARWAHGDDGAERAKVLDLLFEAGASVLAVDGGLTPGEAARGHGASKEVREWFSQHEAV